MRLLGKLRERNRDGTAHLPEAPAAAAQEEFERLCRQADYELGQPGAATVLGPSGQPAAIWLRELREEFSRLAHAGPRRPAAAAATGQPLVLAALESGRPLYWQAAGDAAPPRVALLPLADEENRRTLALSTLLLVLVLAVWILARFFRAGSWPEQLVVLGILGALLFGPVVGRLFVLLVPAGIGARSVQLLTWLRASRLTRKEEPPAAIAEG